MNTRVVSRGSQVKVESSLFIFVVSILLSAVSALAAGSVSVDVSRIGDASHFEFSGRSDWKYDLKRDASGKHVVLNLSGLSPDSLSKLRGLKDSLIQGVSINENGVDGAADVSFSVGATADFFDYIAESPSRLVIDFFPNEKNAKAAKSAKSGAKKEAA